jgi:hypothetical protein
MGKYTSYARQKPKIKRGQVHPIMRGIGCILFVIVPIISYGSAVLLVNYGVSEGWPIPPDWLGTPAIPDLLWKLRGLEVILRYLQAQTNLTANLVFAFALAILIFGVLSMVYGFMFKLLGPPEYGPTDEPPIRGVKVKRYKR